MKKEIKLADLKISELDKQEIAGLIHLATLGQNQLWSASEDVVNSIYFVPEDEEFLVTDEGVEFPSVRWVL